MLRPPGQGQAAVLMDSCLGLILGQELVSLPLQETKGVEKSHPPGSQGPAPSRGRCQHFPLLMAGGQGHGCSDESARAALPWKTAL